MSEKIVMRLILLLLLLLTAVIMWGIHIAMQDSREVVQPVQIIDCQSTYELAMRVLEEDTLLQKKLRDLSMLHAQFKMETVKAVLILTVIEKHLKAIPKKDRELVSKNLRKLEFLLARDAPKVEELR